MDFKTSFLADTKSLFLEGKKDHMGSYLYSTPNPEIQDDPAKGEVYYMELISKNSNYYLYREEIELINQVYPKMASYVPPEASIIEFGPGTDKAFKNKSLPFLKAVKNLKSYIPVDICQTYLDDSEAILKEELPQVSVKTINSDFIKNVDLVKDFPNPVVFFKGSTITNLSIENCLAFLTRIGQALQPNGLLIVGVDSNQNESSLRQAYDDGKMANLTESILYFINRDLPVTGFNPYGFQYLFNWDSEKHCVEHNVKATEDQEFVLDNTPVKVKQGQKFHLLSSYKYPIDYFQSIAKQAGLKPKDCLVHEDGRMVIHILGV